MRIVGEVWSDNILASLDKANRLSELYNTKCHVVGKHAMRALPALWVFLDGMIPIGYGYFVIETINPPSHYRGKPNDTR